MKHLCGRTATVVNVYYDEYKLLFDGESEPQVWAFSLDMFESYDGKNILFKNDEIIVYKENGKTHIEVMD
jgi:hypothetical protein